MYELIELLRNLPKPLKYLGAVFLFIPLAMVLSNALGIYKYWWMVLGGMVLIAIIASLFDLAMNRRDKKQGDALAGEIRKEGERGAGASKQEVREAVKELSGKWDDAVKQLQGTGLSLYSLPWYMLIGEPQSGKSTTLKNSGLEFPVGGEGLSGTGGTRSCDWWFANEAVILDTAGRFTFQEENAPDSAEWSTFLKLLKRHRKFCPINGVIIVVPCTSLLEDKPEEMEKKAQNIRAKLMNLQRVLEIRFPIFIMVTKADRILGFSEFFSKLDPVDQKQLFGWSNPVGTEKGYDPAQFDASFEDIATRAHKMRLRFSSTEENVVTVDRLFIFPEELRALKDPLKRYLDAIFVANRYDEPFLFRGYYVSSGVQQGRPIAKAMRELLGSGTADAKGGGVVEDLESIFKKSRAFFIRDFYDKKVFPEQGLIVRTAAAREREKKVTWAIRIVAAAIVLLVVGCMIPAWIGLKRIVNPVRLHVTQAQECVDKGPCTVAKAYELSKKLNDDRAELRKHPFIFALFLKGTKSNEINQYLALFQQKLYLEYVAIPLMNETEARSGVLDWSGPYDYRTFFVHVENHMRWFAWKNPPQDAAEILVKTKELQLKPVIAFLQNTKGVKATTRSEEIDGWTERMQLSDQTPEVLLQAVLPDKAQGIAPPPETVSTKVPSLDKPVKKFEEFWTIANLAKWDYKLYDLLQKYVAAYQGTIGTDDPVSQTLLARSATAGSELEAIGKLVDAHLATARPGATGFPGAWFEDWRKNFNTDYDALIKYTSVAPGLVNEGQRAKIIGDLSVGAKNLESQRNSYVYLVEADAQPARMKWTANALSVRKVVVDVTGYGDLVAFEASPDRKNLVQQASGLSSVPERTATLDKWRQQQDGLRIAALGPDIGKLDIGGLAPGFNWPQARNFVNLVSEVAYVYRIFPPAKEFFEKAIGPSCGGCLDPAVVRVMIPSASGFVVQTEQARIAGGRPDVASMRGSLSNTEVDYLKRYIDTMGTGYRPSGGGGFYVPLRAMQLARTWREYQQIVAKWNPSAGGGEAAAPAERSGELTEADFAQFASANTALRQAYDYYKQKVLPRKQPQPGGGKKEIEPELMQALDVFRSTVTGVDQEPLKAWKTLATAIEPPSLKGYHSFSRNLRVKNNPTHGRALVEAEGIGAHLVRDSIRPQYAQSEEPVWAKLQSCCTNQFPFVSEAQLRQQRISFYNGELFKPGRVVSGGVARQITLDTLSQASISDAFPIVGSLADQYALDPILQNQEPEFDFVGLPRRPVIAVARGWERFLFGIGGTTGNALGGGGRSAGGFREHKIDVTVLDFPPAPGRKFVGERVGAVSLFDTRTRLRPSTDRKSGAQPQPFLWRMAPSDASLAISGRNEDKAGWTGTLEILGGPLRFFYYVRLASDERDASTSPREWRIRVVTPDAERPNEPLEGVYQLLFDEPMPPILPN